MFLRDSQLPHFTTCFHYALHGELTSLVPISLFTDSWIQNSSISFSNITRSCRSQMRLMLLRVSNNLSLIDRWIFRQSCFTIRRASFQIYERQLKIYDFPLARYPSALLINILAVSEVDIAGFIARAWKIHWENKRSRESGAILAAVYLWYARSSRHRGERFSCELWKWIYFINFEKPTPSLNSFLFIHLFQ